MNEEYSKKIIDVLEDIAFQLSKINDNIGVDGLGERFRLSSLNTTGMLHDIKEGLSKVSKEIDETRG